MSLLHQQTQRSHHPFSPHPFLARRAGGGFLPRSSFSTGFTVKQLRHTWKQLRHTRSLVLDGFGSFQEIDSHKWDEEEAKAEKEVLWPLNSQ